MSKEIPAGIKEDIQIEATKKARSEAFHEAAQYVLAHAPKMMHLVTSPMEALNVLAEMVAMATDLNEKE